MHYTAKRATLDRGLKEDRETGGGMIHPYHTRIVPASKQFHQSRHHTCIHHGLNPLDTLMLVVLV